MHESSLWLEHENFGGWRREGGGAWWVMRGQSTVS